MRNIAACYSANAVKVSDSHCSSYSDRRLLPPRLNAVVSTYKVKLSPLNHLLITIAWSTKLEKGFWIRVSRKSNSGQHDSALRMRSEKGRERFTACGSTVDVSWDLSSATFDGSGSGPSPEPAASFYVVVLIDSVVGLVVGDDYNNIENNSVDNSLVSRCEHVSGSTRFATRARFCDSGKVHEVVIRCGAEANEVGPVLVVVIDGKTVVRVGRLRWNFRGNQVVFVDGLLVDVMWDVHRWMMAQERGRSTVGDGGYDGVFMFRTRSGLDSRLWFEEERLANEDHDKVEFCFLVCATKKLG